MKKIIFITFFATILLAHNPKVYSALGDVIYDNVNKISKLEDIQQYEIYSDKIAQYRYDVENTKIYGLAIEAGDTNIDKKEYLNKLRTLSQSNDFFIRSVKRKFKTSLEEEDSLLFSKLINSGLLDTKANKDEIINYYFSHVEDINASGVIQTYLDNDAKLRAKKEAQRKLYKTKQMKEEERIARIRKIDKEKQAELEKKLEDEVVRKKLEIRENQKNELFK